MSGAAACQRGHFVRVDGEEGLVVLMVEAEAIVKAFGTLIAALDLEADEAGAFGPSPARGFDEKLLSEFRATGPGPDIEVDDVQAARATPGREHEEREAVAGEFVRLIGDHQAEERRGTEEIAAQRIAVHLRDDAG